MQRRTWQRWAGAATLGAALLTGCGSGVRSAGGPSGGGASGGLPNTTPIGSGGGAAAVEQGAGTARFHVDLPSGRVTITPLKPANARSRAQFDGSSVQFTHATSYERPGNRGVRVVDTTMTNTSGLMFYSAQVLFQSISTGAPLLDVSHQATVTTLAGSGTAGGEDGVAAAATFNSPAAVCFGPSGELYVSDAKGYRVRRVDGGQVTTLAGTGVVGAVDGSSTTAGFGGPRGLAYNAADQSLVVCDFGGRRLRRVGLDGSVTTIAGTGAAGSTDGPGTTATFMTPIGVALANNGNTLYVADWDGNCVRRIDYTGTDRRAAASYTVATLAGNGSSGGQDGVGAAATFSGLSGICGSNGNLYVVEALGRRVRQVTTNGAVSTVAGTGAQAYVDGSGEVAAFGQPFGIAAVPQGLVICDSSYHRVRLLTLKSGASGTGASSWWVRTLAGDGSTGAANGDGAAASFNFPAAVAASGDGHLAVVDYAGNRVRRVDLPANIIEPGSSNGASGTVTLSNADGFYPSAGGDVPYKLYRLFNAGPQSIAMQWWFTTPANVTSFDVVVAFESSTAGQIPLQVGSVSAGSSQNAIRTLAGPASGTAGYADGEPNAALFSSPSQIAVDGTGAVYVADTNNHCIRRVGITGQVTTVVGTPGAAGDAVGVGQAARLNQPSGVAISSDGSWLAISDYANHKVKLAHRAATGSPADGATWTVTTIAGGGADAVTKSEIAATTAQLLGPSGLAYSSTGELILADVSAHWVRKLRPINGDPASWMTSVLAGSGANSSSDGTLASGTVAQPRSVALGRHGEIYVSDLHDVRVITPTANSLTTLAGVGAATLGGLAVDDDNQVFATAEGANVVVRVDSGGAVVVVGKTSTSGNADGTGDVARLGAGLRGLAFDSSGTLYLVDGNRLRLVNALVHGA